MNYQEFANKAASEKITLATMVAAKRLMGWTLHSGSVYKMVFADSIVVDSVEQNGTLLLVAESDTLSASEYYYDRSAKTLYVRTSDSTNPNGKFITLRQKFFFSSAPVSLPHDLSSGYDVYWEPQIDSTSQFGVEIDTIKQLGEGIEGKGSLTLFNDQSFWPKNFDKLTFENQDVRIYSWNRSLEVSEAKLLFRGKVEKKSYSDTKISFQLNDLLSELRNALPLANIEDLGERTSESLKKAKQRRIYGRVFGHLPVNLDEVLDGYPLTGTVSISIGSPTLSGVGTDFRMELSPDDRIVLDGQSYTIATITNATQATLSENYAADLDLSGAQAYVLPNVAKTYTNRRWLVAGHATRQPTTFTRAGSTIARLVVESTKDMYPGDVILVGESQTIAVIDKVVSSEILALRTSILTVPSFGTIVQKPSVQNVRIDDILLRYGRDYTYDPETAILELTQNAELLSAPVKQMKYNVAFTNGSRTVTGTGFESLTPGFSISCLTRSDFFRIASIESDTSLTLQTPATFTDSGKKGTYRESVFDPNSKVLSLDCMGLTDDGTPTGNLLSTVPEIVESLIVELGLGNNIDDVAFNTAKALRPQTVGLVVPDNRADTKTPTYRDLINRLNKSVMGSLVQNDNFKLSYVALRPLKGPVSLYLRESDILAFKFLSTGENLAKTSIVTYGKREHNYSVSQATTSQVSSSSSEVEYLLKDARETIYESVLVNESDAKILANRWSFLTERSSGRLEIRTKLQGSSLDIGDIIWVEHRKLFERASNTNKVRIMLVEAVRKSGLEVIVECTDLSGSFNRVATISTLGKSYSEASDREKLTAGFITDEFGLIDNDPDSFGSNLIW